MSGQPSQPPRGWIPPAGYPAVPPPGFAPIPGLPPPGIGMPPFVPHPLGMPPLLPPPQFGVFPPGAPPFAAAIPPPAVLPNNIAVPLVVPIVPPSPSTPLGVIPQSSVGLVAAAALPTAAAEPVKPKYPPPPELESMKQLQQQPPFIAPYLIDRKTTVFVQQISNEINNEIIKHVFEICGPVENWRRLSDARGNFKNFGWCDFKSAESAARAIRILNNFPLGGSKLTVKTSDDKTKNFLAEYEKRKLELFARFQQRKWDDLLKVTDRIEVPKPPAPNAPVDYSTMATQLALPNILIAVRVRDEDRDMLQAQQNKDDDIIKNAIASFIASLSGKDVSLTEQDIQKQTIAMAAVQNTVERITREAPSEEADEKRKFLSNQIKKFRELERDREKEKIDLEREKERQRENDRQRQVQREIQRERDRAKQLEKDRERERHRKEKLIKELERAERDREMYAERIERMSQDNSDDEYGGAPDDYNGHHHHRYQQGSGYYKGSGRHGKKRSRSRSNSLNNSDDERKRAVRIIRKEKAFYMASEKQQIIQPMVSAISLVNEHSAQQQNHHVVPSEKIQNLFNPDEDYDDMARKKSAQFMKILDPAELERQVQAEEEEKQRKEQWKKERTDPQLIVKRIPNEKEPLFAYPMQWDLIDQHNLVSSRVQTFIESRIQELLGEAEQSLVEFIMSKLKLHEKPEELEKELREVLAEDTEAFLIKLWRMLIFEMLKTQGELEVYGKVQQA